MQDAQGKVEYRINSTTVSEMKPEPETSLQRVTALEAQIAQGKITIREALVRIQYNPSITYITGSMGSDYNDKYNTPPHIVRAVEDCLDGIDLDPCSNSRTEPYTIPKKPMAYHNLGLVKLFINPPYGDAIGLWVDKLLCEYNAGNVTEALMLLPARQDTQWFQVLYDYYLCMVKGRLTFGDSEYNAPFPSVVVYVGKQPWKFSMVFGQLGRIMQCAYELDIMKAIMAPR